MKKIMTACLLAALAALTAWAQSAPAAPTASFGGSLDAIQTLGTGDADEVLGVEPATNTRYIDARLKFVGKPADYASVTMVARARSYDAPGTYMPAAIKPAAKDQVTDTVTKGAFDWEFLYAEVDTIGALGLDAPAKAKLIFGKIDYTSKNYLRTTGTGMECVMSPIRSGDAVNLGLEVSLKNAPFTFVAFSRANIDEAVEELDSDDVATGDTVPALYFAGRVEKMDLGFGTLSAEAAYAMNTRKINAGSAFGASAQLSIPLSEALTVPVGLGVAYSEKNIDMLVDESSKGFRETVRVGFATGVTYKAGEAMTIALNLGGSYNVIKHATFDDMSIAQVAFDAKVTRGSLFGGAGVAFGTLADVDVGPTEYTLENSLGLEAYVGISPAKFLTVSAGYARYSGLSARYGIENKADASYKFVDDDGVMSTNALFVKTSIKF